MTDPSTLSYYERQIQTEKSRLLSEMPDDSDQEDDTIKPILDVMQKSLSSLQEIQSKFHKMSESRMPRITAANKQFQEQTKGTTIIKETVLATVPAIEDLCLRGKSGSQDVAKTVNWQPFDDNINWPIMDRRIFEKINRKITKYPFFAKVLDAYFQRSGESRKLQSYISGAILNEYTFKNCKIQKRKRYDESPLLELIAKAWATADGMRLEDMNELIYQELYRYRRAQASSNFRKKVNGANDNNSSVE